MKIPSRCWPTSSATSRRISASTTSASAFSITRPKRSKSRPRPGSRAQALGKRIALGAGILGRVARSGEAALVQTSSEAQLQGVLPGSRSVLCIPIAYGENVARRSQRGKPQRRCFHAGRPSDHEHAGRPAGHGPAQRFRVPETAAAVDHRRAHAASRPGVSSSKH